MVGHVDVAGWAGGFVLDFLNEQSGCAGLRPCGLDLLELLSGLFAVAHEVCVYELGDVFGWVDVVWHLVADGNEVITDARN